ncbi:MAG: hypothetical protein L0211_20055 [Planctomycetaceae bacterium]|nr:hypothetical protein [Planctomycetaceae bacterium]
MTLHRSCSLLCLLALAPGLVAAQEPASLKQQHPWARFPLGSWKSVRVVSETLDAKGNVANIIRTETRTTLIAANHEGYSLRVESTVEVAGKRFASQPQIVKHGYYGETAGQPVTVKKLGDEEVYIDGRGVPSEVRQATFEADGIKRSTKIYYSSTVSPYQLRRETTTDGLPVEQSIMTTVETVATGLPLRVLNEMQPASYIKTTRLSPQGTKVTLEAHCDKVPGGVVTHTSSDSDPSGLTTRRSTLELIDYAIGGHPITADPVTRRRMFHRARPRRMNQ